jgi:hypothetical protein
MEAHFGHSMQAVKVLNMVSLQHHSTLAQRHVKPDWTPGEITDSEIHLALEIHDLFSNNQVRLQ